MQLSFFADGRTDLLVALQARLLARFGPWHRAQRRDPVGTLIHGLVGWKTRTELTLTIVDALEAEFGGWEGVRDADTTRLTAAIAPVTFPELKAPRIQDALREITRRRGGLSLDHLATLSVPAAVAWLETLPDVGRKIAGEVLNTSAIDRLALVIDGHHHRVMRRLGVVRATATVAELYGTKAAAAAQLDPGRSRHPPHAGEAAGPNDLPSRQTGGAVAVRCASCAPPAGRLRQPGGRTRRKRCRRPPIRRC